MQLLQSHFFLANLKIMKLFHLSLDSKNITILISLVLTHMTDEQLDTILICLTLPRTDCLIFDHPTPIRCDSEL